MRGRGPYGRGSSTFGPFALLLREDCADEAYDKGLAGENSDQVGPAAGLPVQALVRIVALDLSPGLVRERRELGDVRSGGLEV